MFDTTAGSEKAGYEPMTPLVQKLSKTFRKLAGHPDGNVSIFFAIAALPLLLAAGMAIDYIRIARVQTELQAATDSAALATAMAETGDPNEKKIAGANYFKSNSMNAELEGVAPTIAVNGDKITITASVAYPTTFMALAGIYTMTIDAASEVEGGQSLSAEVALVLDYSGSMTKNNKYIRMRDATVKLIDDLAANAKGTTVKFGIVPFSAMVRTSMPADYVTQPSAGATWTGCTQDRKYSWNVGVATPDGTPDSKWGYIDNFGSENSAPNYDCAKYQANKLDIMPLSPDAAAVKTRLAEMYPVGNTNIPLGAEFGWNLLDPEAPFTEGAAYSDEKTKKFLVLLTDGVQTSSHWGDQGTRSVANGNDNLVTICKNTAAKGITIFAIAYDITTAAVTKLLKDCAGSNYFEANTGEIDSVFNAITERIKRSTLRITR